MSDNVMDTRLREMIDQFQGKRGATIPVLQAVQEEYGYIPKEAFMLIEEMLGIPSSKTYGVATFYAQFRLVPQGKHIIKVCNGTACHVKGSETLLETIRDDLDLSEEQDTTEDGLFTVEEVACLGCCSLAPVIMVGETTYGNLNVEEMRGIVKRYREGGSE